MTDTRTQVVVWAVALGAIGFAPSSRHFTSLAPHRFLCDGGFF